MNKDVNNDIVRFIQEAKRGFPNMLFGMILPKDMKVIDQSK